MTPLRPFRRTVRLRLTVLYGVLFLTSGAGLLTATYLLVEHATGNAFIYSVSGQSVAGQVIGVGSGSGASGPTLTVGGPQPLTPDQLQAQAEQMRDLAIRQHQQELHQLLIWSGVALAIMAVLSVGLGWLMAGRVLRPLRTITSAVHDISATNLHRRLTLAGPDDELRELGDTFDALLERLDTAFAAQRRFVANASHELRTPLARQRALGQVALADPDATVTSLRAAHERVLVAGAQQERIIDALLALARGQAGLDRDEGFDLAGIAGPVLAAREAEARFRELDIRAELDPAPGAGDPRLVERLVANLVDNALRHNAPGGFVEIHTGVHAGRGVLRVANSGPVVPDRAVEILFQPFRRLCPDRTGPAEGIGLGLSIVAAVAESHHATVTTRPRASGGLELEVSFPAPARGRELQPAGASPGRGG